MFKTIQVGVASRTVIAILIGSLLLAGLTVAVHAPQGVAKVLQGSPAAEAQDQAVDLAEAFPEPIWQPDPEKTKAYKEIVSLVDAAAVYADVFSCQRAVERWREIRDRGKKEFPDADWFQTHARLNIARMQKAMTFSEEKLRALEKVKSNLRNARSLFEQQRCAEAIQTCDESILLLVDVWGEDDPTVAYMLYTIVDGAMTCGDFGSAKTYAYRLLECQKKVYGETDPELLPGLLCLAQIEQLDEQYATFENLVRMGYRIGYHQCAALRSDVSSLTVWRTQYAASASAKGDFATARTVLQRDANVLQRDPSILPETKAEILRDQAHVEIADGHCDRAWLLIQQANSIMLDANCKQDVDCLFAEIFLWRLLNELRLAAKRTTQELDILDKDDIRLTMRRLMLLRDLADLRSMSKDPEAAERAVRAAKDLASHLATVPPNIANELRISEGLCEIANGRGANAVKILGEIDAVRQRAGMPDTFRYSNRLVHLARAHLVNNSPSQAEAILLRCQAIREKKLREGHPDRGEVLYELGAAYMEQKKYAEAEKALAQAEAIYRKAVGERWPVYRNVLRRQVELYCAMNRQADATKLDERLKALDAKYPPLEDGDNLPASEFRSQ